MYQLIADRQPVIRLSDGKVLGSDTAEFAEYLAWVAAGNTPAPPPPPTVSEANAQIMTQIRALEASELLPRSVRDLIKKSVTEDAAALGYTLDQVYAVAVAQGEAAPEAAKSWKKFKDFDDQIQALKEQLQ